VKGSGINRKYFLLANLFMKKNADGYQPNKAKAITFEEYEKFWGDLNEERDAKGILRKVLSLCAYYAADHSVETSGLLRENVEINKREKFIEITTVKRKGNKLQIKHIVPSIKSFDSVLIFVKLGPKERLFKQFDPNPKRLKNQNVGCNYLTSVTQHIARYLGKDDFAKFTSQGARSACATEMIESCADVEFIGKQEIGSPNK